MTSLHPWALGPFELLTHAEEHFQRGEDFDRRMALILFDDAVEVAVATYLSLHPIQRGNRSYVKNDVDRWLHDYHSKLDFLEAELIARKLEWEVERAHAVWAHDHRNEQYHGGKKGTPEWNVLDTARRCALWVFGVLFEVPDCEERVIEKLAIDHPAPLERDPELDRAIDDAFPMIEIGPGSYYPSELLFAADYSAYLELGSELFDAGLAEGEPAA